MWQVKTTSLLQVIIVTSKKDMHCTTCQVQSVFVTVRLCELGELLTNTCLHVILSLDYRKERILLTRNK